MRFLSAAIGALGLAAALSVCAHDQASGGHAPVADAELESLFAPAASALCRQIAWWSDDSPAVTHTDCGMGRHCPEEHRCCLTSSEFWCCPSESKCDYEHPQGCKAP